MPGLDLARLPAGNYSTKAKLNASGMERRRKLCGTYMMN